MRRAQDQLRVGEKLVTVGNRAERKCGTCKHFFEAGIVNSGWCRHPKRAELHNLVLVRRAELACRNSMDQDLWEPAESNVTARRTEREDTLIHASAANEPAEASGVDQSTDVVTQIGEPRYRESERSTVDAPDEAAASAPAVERNPVPFETERRMPTAMRVTDEGRASASAGNANSRLHREHRLPYSVFGTTPTAKPYPDCLALSPSDSWRFSSKAAPPPPGGQALARDGYLKLHGGRGVSGGEGGGSNDTQPLPPIDEPHISTAHTVASHDARQAVRDANRASTRTGAVPSSQVKRGGRLTVFIDGHQAEDISSERAFEAATPIPKRLDPEQAPIDRMKWAAPIARCCDTCRDFRRNPDGRTGICSNLYAFPEPTMVECHQLACRSSTGVWWLPSDDVWLESVDIARHTRPTPYLEAALGQAGRR